MMSKRKWMAMAGMALLVLAAGCSDRGGYAADQTNPQEEIVQETQEETSLEKLALETEETAAEETVGQTEESIMVTTEKAAEALVTEAQTETPAEAPTEEQTEAPTEAPTEAQTEAPTEAPTEAQTEVPTEAPTTEQATVPETQPVETAPPPAERSIYDYPFDLEAIRAEMIAIGTGQGLVHDPSMTPDNSNWAVPVTASESFQGDALKRSLTDYVSSTPEIIIQCGGEPITSFCIYIQDNGDGSYTFFYLD